MNNFIIALKRFLKNKNTVTIVGVLLILLILFLGYRHQINQAVTPVSGIPVAASTIQPRTKITNDMLDTIQVAPVVLSKNVIREKGQVINKYTSYNIVIPEGSMFYKNTISNSYVSDTAFVDLKEDEIPYNFPVTTESTYGNTILPGNYIDIYMKATNDKDELMVGKLLENVKVLAVKDSQGKNVFEDSEKTRTPAFLIFGLNSELNILLRKASYLTHFRVKLFPVPQVAEVAAKEGETMVSSQTLKDFINANTVPNDEITAQEETENAKKSAEEEQKENKKAKENADKKGKESSN